MNQQPPDGVPVLISGAGPVGLSLALGLARCGVRSVVLEKKSELSPHSRALGVLPRTLEILRAWGVLDAFLKSGTFLTGPQIWMQGESTPVARLNFSVLEKLTSPPGVLILPQDGTERLLLDEVLKTQRSEVRFGHELLGFSQDETGVMAQVRSRDGVYSLRALYLIGCDGAHSRVREVLDWKLEGKTYPTRILLADVELRDARDELPWPRVAPLPVGVLAAVRYAPNRWRLIHTLTPNHNEDVAVAKPYITSLVGKVLGGGPVDLIWSSVFRIHCRHSARFVQNRVVLCGDAAHLNSPAGGQGMNSGIHDAHNLAWKLAAIFQGGEAGVLLASYEAERLSAVQTGIERFTDLLTRMILLASPRRRVAFLRLAAYVMRLDAVREVVTKRATMLDTRYPRSPILAPPASGASTLLGRRAPDGDITRAAETRRLLDCVWPHATVLLFDDARLPHWDESQIRVALQNIAPVPIEVLRLVAREAPADNNVWRDATGQIFAAWHIDSATAALLRPDGHIGWVAARPLLEELQAGVKGALGAP